MLMAEFCVCVRKKKTAVRKGCAIVTRGKKERVLCCVVSNEGNEHNGNPVSQDLKTPYFRDWDVSEAIGRKKAVCSLKWCNSDKK